MSPTDKPKTAKKGRRKSTGLRMYVLRTFHRDHPNMTISSSAVETVTKLVDILFRKLVFEGKNLMKATRKPGTTFKVKTLRAAVSLLSDDQKAEVIPYMTNEAEKALKTYSEYQKEQAPA